MKYYTEEEKRQGKLLSQKKYIQKKKQELLQDDKLKIKENELKEYFKLLQQMYLNLIIYEKSIIERENILTENENKIKSSDINKDSTSTHNYVSNELKIFFDNF